MLTLPPQENIYDSTKDTCSVPHVNRDRHFSIFLRKDVSIFFAILSTQIPFISLLGQREEDEKEGGVEFLGTVLV